MSLFRRTLGVKVKANPVPTEAPNLIYSPFIGEVPPIVAAAEGRDGNEVPQQQQELEEHAYEEDQEPRHQQEGSEEGVDNDGDEGEDEEPGKEDARTYTDAVWKFLSWPSNEELYKQPGVVTNLQHRQATSSEATVR
jgi:hypothetical protein